MPQAVKDCNRCTANNKAGNRCKNRTCRGEKCWIHTKKEDGLRIKKSQIANAGLGLHSTRRFGKGDKITEYSGEKMTREAIALRYPGDTVGEYVVCRDRKTCWDGRKTSSSFARFANDARSTQFTNNARFTPGAHNRTPIVRATRNIPINREIFVDYGPGYWK